MKKIIVAALLALCTAAHAEDAPKPPQPEPISVELTASEYDSLIRWLAEAPAKYSFQPIELLRAKQQMYAASKGQMPAPSK